MKEKLEQIRRAALERIAASEALETLNEIRVAYLGKKGELTGVLKGMRDVSVEERPRVGQMVNDTRAVIEAKLEERKARLAKKAREEQLKREVIDVTLPAKKNHVGHKHPNMIALEEVERIFVGMGYEVVEGPEVEYDYYNFEALNIPKGHPARDEQDTFYINDSILLRSQTSPVQVRTMEKGKLPIRMIAPGRVFRSDEVDATHSPSFHQIEGLVIDKNIGGVRQGTVRGGHQGEVPPSPFPLHGAQRRGGRELFQMPRQGLPFLQGERLDRDFGLRHGPSQCAEDVQDRPGGVLRLRLRHGPGADRPLKIRDRRHAPAV